jgi:hypothetical protein
MWWECSECGGYIECSRAPAVCCECGTAGVIFVLVDIDEATGCESDAGGLKAAWLRAGMAQAELTLGM